MDSTRFHDQAMRDNGNTHDIEREIERTRHEMDETLEEIGQRLHPRHLLDEVLDLFRSEEHGSDRRQMYAQQAKDAGRSIVRAAREHPIPTLLWTAGAAWLLFDKFGRDEDRGSDSSFKTLGKWSAGREPSHATEFEHSAEMYESPEPEWSGVAAWHPGHDWSQAAESESAWNTRAERTIQEARQILDNENLSHGDRLRLVAAKLMSVSGRKRSEIRSRWRNLREYSGSFVDARTGEPYSPTYGRELESIMACDCAASFDWDSEQVDKSRSTAAVEQLKATLSDTGLSVKDKLHQAVCQLRDLVDTTTDASSEYRASLRDTSGSWMGRARDRAAEMGRSMSRTYRAGRERMRRGYESGSTRLSEGYGHARESLQHGWESGRERLQHGYESSRDALQRGYEASRQQIESSMDEHPLAVGAATLGLGMLAGMLIPQTRRENEMMGAASEDLRRSAKEMGADLMERGQHVAEAAVQAATEEMDKAGLSTESAVSAIEKGGEKLLEGGERIAGAAVSAAKQEVKHQADDMQGWTKEASQSQGAGRTTGTTTGSGQSSQAMGGTAQSSQSSTGSGQSSQANRPSEQGRQNRGKSQQYRQQGSSGSQSSQCPPGEGTST